MEGVVNKIAKAVERAAKNNTVINVCLVAAFVALGARSVSQQRDIQALESEMDSLISSNKALKKAMWDWKQQLFADADSDSALVPLARLKAIYGDAPVSQTGDASKEDANSLHPNSWSNVFRTSSFRMLCCSILDC